MAEVTCFLWRLMRTLNVQCETRSGTVNFFGDLMCVIVEDDEEEVAEDGIEKDRRGSHEEKGKEGMKVEGR